MASKKRPRSTEEPTEGYPDEIFQYLTNEEKQDYQCNICLQVVRRPVFCENAHFFCSGCVDRWREASKDRDLDDDDLDPAQPPPPSPWIDCPVCRTRGQFTDDEELAKLLEGEEVVCNEPDCWWTGELAGYDEHVTVRHAIGEPSKRRLRSSESKTERITYHF